MCIRDSLSPVHGNSDDVEDTDEVRPPGEDQDVHVPQTARRLERKETYEEQLLSLVKQKMNQENQKTIDEETNFALSLVPTLKSLPEENKLQARIEILNVLQKLKFRAPFHSFTGIIQPNPREYQGLHQAQPIFPFHHQAFHPTQQHVESPSYPNPQPSNYYPMNSVSSFQPSFPQACPTNTDISSVPSTSSPKVHQGDIETSQSTTKSSNSISRKRADAAPVSYTHLLIRLILESLVP